MGTIKLPISKFLILILLISPIHIFSKTTLNNNFNLILQDNDPFKSSQDFLSPEIEAFPSLRSAIIPFNMCIKACSNSETFTNLLLFTRSDEELRDVLRNITTQASTINSRPRLNCRVFISINSCNRTLSLKLEDFYSDITNKSILHPFNWKSDLYMIQYCDEKPSQVSIWEVYSVKNTIFTIFLTEQKSESRDRVTFNLTEFSLAHINNPKIVRRHDLDGLNLTAAAFFNKDDEGDNPFELKLERGENGEETFVSGFSVSILKDFKTALNFTEKPLKIYFNLPNYFETSFISEDYQFDINIFHTGVTRNRSKVAQPLLPTFFDGVHAIFIQPSDRAVRNIYRKPFEFQMWWVLFSTWACIFLSFKLTTYFLSKLKTQIPMHPKEQTYMVPRRNSETTTFETLLWCVGCICQQGCDTLPKSTPTRLIVTSGLLLSLICYSAYTGKIVSELWDVPKPIKNLNQLLTYTDKVYLISSSDTSNDILEGLAASPSVLKKVRFRTLDTIYRKLREHSGKACTITWPDSVYSYAQETFQSEHGDQLGKIDAYLCDTFNSFTFQSSSCMFVPKYSEFEQLFNYRILFGLERGFIRRYWNTYSRHTKLFCLRNNPHVTTLGFSDVFFALFVLWSGMGSCLLMLVVEMCWVQLRVPVI